jgi:hypothetical protein
MFMVSEDLFRLRLYCANTIAGTDGIINGTMALMVTDLDLFVTPFNTSMLNPHIIALGVSICPSPDRFTRANHCPDVYGWISNPCTQKCLRCWMRARSLRIGETNEDEYFDHEINCIAFNDT